MCPKTPPPCPGGMSWRILCFNFDLKKVSRNGEGCLGSMSWGSVSWGTNMCPGEHKLCLGNMKYVLGKLSMSWGN